MVIEKIYDASPDLVWEAITNMEQMKQWYFELSEFKPELEFHFTFPGEGNTGVKYNHLCTITQIIPNRLLKYSWAYEGFQGYSLVTFEIAEAGNGSKLTLTHEGLNSLPTDNPDFALHNFQEGWNYILGISLAGFLENQK